MAAGGAATLPPPALPAGGFARAAGGAGLAGAGFVPFGAGAATGRGTPRDQDERKRQGGIVSPVVGGAGGAEAARGSRSARIRPGDAARPASRAGVAAGLLGRAAKDAESADIVASTRRPAAKASRTASRRSSDDQDMFLDEDAWLIDDPGAGVVEAHQPHDPGAASAVVG
jgi:hypothetical protein